MSGAYTDPPADLDVTPDYFLGICDECQSVNAFDTARARDLWERFHPHQEVVQ